jgi:hypothetical protein
MGGLHTYDYVRPVEVRTVVFTVLSRRRVRHACQVTSTSNGHGLGTKGPTKLCVKQLKTKL